MPEAGAVGAVPIVTAWAFEAKGQTLLAVESTDAFMVIPPAFTPEHDVNSAVAIIALGFADLPDAQVWRTVVCRHRKIPERAATDPKGKAYLPFDGSLVYLQIPGVVAPASVLFCQHILHHGPVGAQIGNPLLQPEILFLRQSHVLQFR